MAKIIIPTPLRKYTKQNAHFQTTAENVDAAIDNLVETYPDLRKHIMTDDNKLRSFVKVFVEEEDIKDLNKGETKVSEGTTISIVPAIAGGIN